MNSPDSPREPERRIPPREKPAQPGNQRAAQRRRRPGEVGLANEARPGLGTRAAGREAGAPAGGAAIPPVRRPAPREQDSDSLAQEMQRSTGVSGHTSGA